jgi:hypothetical protein
VNMLGQHAFAALFYALATLLIMVGATAAPNGRFSAAYMSLTSYTRGPLARRRATSSSGKCGHGCCIRHGGSTTVTRATLEDTLLEAASDPEIVGAVTQEQLVVSNSSDVRVNLLIVIIHSERRTLNHNLNHNIVMYRLVLLPAFSPLHGPLMSSGSGSTPSSVSSSQYPLMAT